MPSKQIPIERIVITHEFPDEKKIGQIQETIRKEGNIEFFEPIETWKAGTEYFILDGNHRTLAAKKEGYSSMWGYAYHSR